MRRLMRTPVMILAVAGLAWMVAGCGGGASKSQTPDNPTEGIILSEVAEAYRFFSVMKGKPPEKPADLAKMDGISPTGTDAIKRGEVVVLWGAKLPDLGEEAGKKSWRPRCSPIGSRCPSKAGTFFSSIGPSRR